MRFQGRPLERAEVAVGCQEGESIRADGEWVADLLVGGDDTPTVECGLV